MTLNFWLVVSWVMLCAVVLALVVSAAFIVFMGMLTCR